MLSRNTNIQWVRPPTCRKSGDSEKRVCVHKILGLSADGKHAALINIDAPKPRLVIEIFDTSELDQLITNAVAKVVTYKTSPAPETDAVKTYRDIARKMLDGFLDGNTKFLFDRKERARLLKTGASVAGVDLKRARRMFHKWLIAGMSISGMRPSWCNCGTPKSIHGRKTGGKLGRPDSLAPYRHLLVGRTLDDDLKDRFEKGIQKHVKGPTNRRRSRASSFYRTLFDFFAHEVEVEPGVFKPKLEDNLPTYNQFNEYILAHYSRQEIRASRQSKAEQGTSDRSQMSQSESLDPFGPGDCYQIDSTTADIFLVARTGSRRLIGRPTLYLVIDVWSRMIVGFHLTLRSSCYDELVLALLSTIEDKEALCRKWGVEYKSEDWPKTPLCSRLVADRQEVIYNNSNLIADLGPTLVNCPPNRGDLKGLIEDGLGALMTELWQRPGAVDRQHPRDFPDYREDAIYSLREAGQLLLQDVIRLNHRFLPDVPVPKEFADMDEDKTPIKLYNWGSKWHSGCGFACDYDTARRELLPLVTTASSSKDGFRVSAADAHKLDYIPPKGAFPKHWFTGTKGVPVKAQYDSRTVDKIWVRHPETDEMIECHLDIRNFREYLGWTWPEAAAYQFRLKAKGAKLSEQSLQRLHEDYLAELNLSKEAYERAVAQGATTRKGIKTGQKGARAAEPTPEQYSADPAAAPAPETSTSTDNQSPDPERFTPLEEDERY